MIIDAGIVREPEILGTEVGVRIEQFRITSPNSGPRIVIFGGVHGDENEGILSASMVLNSIDELRCGELCVIPRANPSAVAASTRTSSDDGGNLARTFPGSPTGSYTERIAHVLTEQAIRGADALIDLHSGGRVASMPFFAGYIGDIATEETSAAMTQAFAAPLSWRHEGINPGRSLSAAAEFGVPAIYVESGAGGGTLNAHEVDGYVNGVRRVLAYFGLLDEADCEPAASIARRYIPGGSGNTEASISASVAGWCLAFVRSGDVVEAGQLCAQVRDDYGRLLETILAPTAGLVVQIRAVAKVEVDDGLLLVAPKFEAIEP